MQLIECEKYYQYPVGDLFVSGFTKSVLAGVLPDDVEGLFPGSQVTFMDQEHGKEVLSIAEPGRYVCDGVFTSNPELILIVKTADCLPLIFFSEKEQAIGVVHMGWRSAEKGILGNIEVDLNSFTVIAGPGMRRCCYEVGEEFTRYTNFEHALIRKNKNLYFDPVLFAKERLVERGLKEENFFDTDLCSLCSGYDLPSYRKTKTKNRTLSFIAGPKYNSTRV